MSACLKKFEDGSSTEEDSEEILAVRSVILWRLRRWLLKYWWWPGRFFILQVARWLLGMRGGGR